MCAFATTNGENLLFSGFDQLLFATAATCLRDSDRQVWWGVISEGSDGIGAVRQGDTSTGQG